MRVWNNYVQDDGSIHSLGNGQMLAYSQGPDWIQVFGPPYSSPTQLSLVLAMDEPVQVESTREVNCAIWTHQLNVAGQPSGSFQDFCDADLACLVRRSILSQTVRFLLKPAPQVELIPVSGESGGGYLLQTPAGAYFYHTYPIRVPLFSRVLLNGALTTRVLSNGEIEIICLPGESSILICGGPSYPEAVQAAAAAQFSLISAMMERTRQSWLSFSSPHNRMIAMLPESTPDRAALVQAVDDTAILIKTQQDAGGGVMAGYNYHMAYVRDQYGVSRGLLALGQVDSARKILGFYWKIWQRHGRIHNAQAAGVDGAFHIHEYDGSEITGYLIQQAFDLSQKTGDLDFSRQIFPMLEWAFETQVGLLVDDMLPFNGDETYIAGGILPRTTINDGSAEATLLFIESGRKLLNFIQNFELWPALRVNRANSILNEVSSRYRQNFMPQGILITNNPARSVAAPLPPFRHGVCERCHAENRSRGIEWTARNETGRYLCPRCLALGNYPAVPAQIYTLQSVSLSPLYMHSSLLGNVEIEPALKELAARYTLTGQLPSRPDDPTGTTVGYDYGLFLYALTTLKHPLAAEIYDLTLRRTDSTGAWVEYYRSGQPSGTRCRPWESAINIEALLNSMGL